jgi:DNA-binding CsgD family transcriptional regulator
VLNPGEPLEFVHPIVRTATYEDIAESERAALHKRAAEILAAEGAEPEAIAVHLLPTNPAGDACVVEHLRAAAAAALVRGGPETTLRYLNRAIVEPPGEELEAVVALELGSAAERAGDPDSIDLLRRAFELARAPEQRAVAAIEFSHAAFSHGFLDDAVKGNEQGLEAAREAEDVELTAHLEGSVLLSATTVGPRWKWRDLLESAYERVDALPAAAARPMLVALCFDKAFCGPTAARAAELAERAMDAGELLREYTAHSNLVYPPAFVLTFVDRLEAAERAVTECFADASTRGSVHGLVLSAGLRSATRFWRGDLAGAETDARMALELGAEGGLAQMLPLPLASLLAVLLERGQPHEAERVLAEHEPLAGVPDIPPGGPSLHESKARLMWARGELDAALAELRAIERWEREYGATSGVVQVRWRAMAALIHHRLGEHDEALRLATEQVELAKRFEAPIAIGVALRALGIVVGGDTGIERLIEATSVLEQSEGRLEHARALIDLGAALRRTGRATESRDRLGEGMDLAHRLGATALVDVAVDELRMAGARPRRAALRGRDALTPGELRVAEMAAQGMTNKEIAQALFVTLRTVEMHLSNAYGKLEIKSRRELPSALAA